jgi:hypothetical protein
MEFGGSWFVVRGSWFVVVVFYVPTVPTVLQYSTDPTGISRPCTEVLRTRTYSSAAAAKTLLRSRASRGHLNLLFVDERTELLCINY